MNWLWRILDWSPWDRAYDEGYEDGYRDALDGYEFDPNHEPIIVNEDMRGKLN